jgi:hypothetical protein
MQLSSLKAMNVEGHCLTIAGCWLLQVALKSITYSYIINRVASYEVIFVIAPKISMSRWAKQTQKLMIYHGQ